MLQPIVEAKASDGPRQHLSTFHDFLNSSLRVKDGTLDRLSDEG